MPLHARVYVNEHEISEGIHIGRLEGGTRPSDINTYKIVVGNRPETYEDWLNNGVSFTHRYGDGAIKCYQLGLNAYFEDIEKGWNEVE